MNQSQRVYLDNQRDYAANYAAKRMKEQEIEKLVAAREQRTGRKRAKVRVDAPKKS